MNRFYLRFSYLPVIAFVLFLASSSAIYAQTNYTVVGTLSLQSGSDPVGLDGSTVTALATLTQGMTPSSTTTTSSSSTNTYSGVGGIILDGLQCITAANLTVTLTDNAGAADTISLSNCVIQYATVSATISIPQGAMDTSVPANIPLTYNVTGTVTYSFSGGGASVFDFTDGSIIAVGDAVPSVTSSIPGWTPTAPVGSTLALTQPVTFTTSPNYPVSFTTSVTTTDGGTWLSVSPAANTSSTLMITVNPTGLTQPTYSGMVTLNYGQGLTTSIPVVLTLSGGTAALTGPGSMTFNYTLGGTAPASQTLTIGPAGGIAVNAAVTSGNSWLSISPGSGNTPASFTVSVNTAGITTSQTLTGNIQVTAGGVSNSPMNIPVTLNAGSSTLTVSNTPLTFNYTIGGAAPAAQAVSVQGTSGISAGTSTNGSAWLLVSPSSVTVPGSVNVSVTTAGLTAGTYNGTVTISSPGAAGSPINIPVTFNVIGPKLTVNQSALNFSYQIGGSAPPAQSITVGGTSGLAFTAQSAGGSWLSVSPGSGTTGGSVSVSVSTSGLSAGTYNGLVTISGTGAANQTVSVTLVVTQPAINATPSSLNFAYQIGTTAPAAQTLSVGGTSGLAFTATPAGSWLSLNSTSGTVPGAIGVSINTSGLSTGTYNGSILLAASGATSQTVNVTLVVSNSAGLSASPSALNFAYQIGGTAPTAQPVNVGGNSGLSFTATAATSSGGSWLVANPGSGAVPGNVSVSLNTSVLTTPGSYNGTITIAAPGATSQTVNVSLLVSNIPTIVANPSAVNFSYAIGGSTPSAQSVSITGGSGLSFIPAVTNGSSWLSVSPGFGTTPGSLSVSVNPVGLSAATYHGTVTIASGGASNTPLAIPVTLTITGATPMLSLSGSSLNFSATVGGSAPASQTVTVTSTAPSPVSVSVAGGTWLAATLLGTSTPAVVSVSANPAALTAGSYTGTVIVTSPGASNSPLNIAVTLVVSAAANISVTPSSLSFSYILGGSNPSSQSIQVTSASPAPISMSVAGAPWITVTNSSATTPAALTVSVNPASLPAGTFQGAISITSAGASNSPQIVPVTLVVSTQPTLAPSPSTLTFTAPAGGSNPASQSINLAASAPLQFTIATSPSWLSVSSSGSTTQATLVATVNTAGMNQGSYQGSIIITATGAANSPFTIPVTLNLTVAQAAGVPTISSIVNAASYDTSGFSPGAIVTIFGNLLGPQTGAVFSVNSQGKLDTTLAGVTITVDGEAAIPLYVQNGQINIILPFDLGLSGQANVQVEYNNQTSAQYNIPLSPSDIQIFTQNASGSGPGSILNQDFSVNTATNPAAKGSIVSVYGTGAGLVSPGVIAGDVATDVLSFVSLPFAASVNGEEAVVMYAGSAPSLVYGVDQFNVQLPADAPSGAVSIIVKVGDSASQANVTVFVK
jgi:uncharacterized protein (TIGR03437 family)